MFREKLSAKDFLVTSPEVAGAVNGLWTLKLSDRDDSIVLHTSSYDQIQQLYKRTVPLLQSVIDQYAKSLH